MNESSIDSSAVKDAETGPLSDSVPGTPAEEEDILLLQTRRAELVQERDALALRRLELKQANERLSASLAHYKKQQLQFETRQKLEYYLHQNDHEGNRLTQPDEAAAFVLKNLNVLPTTDVDVRMKLVDKFYPAMHVTHESVLTIYEGDALSTVLAFQVSSRHLPPLNVRLTVRDEAVHAVQLVAFREVAAIFEKISGSFCHTLRKYTRLKKIDLILYSYHSLARVQENRVATLAQILQKYAAHVTRPAAWASDPDSCLVSLSYVELTVSDEQGHAFKVRLQWDLVVGNYAVGEAELQLLFSVHKGDEGPFKDTNGVFLALVLQHGLVEAFSLMMLNLFGIA